MDQKKFNIQIPIESVPVTITKDQKRILEEMVIDLYDAVGRMLIHQDEESVVEGFKNMTTNHFKEILKLILEEKRYIIEVVYQKDFMVFDVESMIEMYGYDKEVIRSEIDTLDSEVLDAIFRSDGAIVLPLFNRSWVATKKGNRIKVDWMWKI